MKRKQLLFLLALLMTAVTGAWAQDTYDPLTTEGVPPYCGTIYVATTGSDDNEGSENAPVATVGKAIELALVNNGSGEIIINEGTYVGNGYHVTGDLTVTGNGKVTLDANNEGRLFYMEYGESANKIELHNLTLTNANGYGAAVYSLANELILDKVNVVKNNAKGFLIKSNGKLSITDSEISESMSGNVIQQDASGDILIKNTVFEDNSIVDSTSVMAVVNINTGSGNMVVENSKFKNNTARQGVIKSNFNYNIEVKGTEFKNNTNTVAYGGAIFASGGILNITDCVFDSNKAYRSGGAIYVGYRVTATVDSCIFINNTANTAVDKYYGDAIYNGNKLTVTNSAFLGGYNNYMIYNDGEDNAVTAQNCWWGTNEDPSSMNGVGYYEDDDWNEYDCPQVDVSDWATMNATFTPASAQAGEEVTVTATFSNDNLPDGIPVTFKSTSGNLDAVVATVGAQASTTYTLDANDDAITATSGRAAVEMPIVQSSTNVVTQDNFYEFFDEYGNLLDDVENDTLIFQGEFADLASYITLDRPITITGDNAVLNDMGFIIAGDDVILDSLTLVANSDLGNLIDIASENVVISNMNITYVVSEAASVINVYPGANNVQILNNTIHFESTVDDYAADEVTTAICVNSGVSVFDDEDPIEGLVIDGNVITAVIPAFLADIYENEYYVIGLSAVNGVRINGAEDFKFTNNKLDVTTNRLSKTTPTLQALYVASSSGLIDGNDILMIDSVTPAAKDIYLYAVELINDEELTISNNNFNLSTTGGKDEAGAAYAITAIASEFDVTGNNITTVSKGPNLGIWFPSHMGAPCDAAIKNNVINVTGLASAAHNTGLVSGIEIQTGSIGISGNKICAYNIGEYAEDNNIYGISYAQDGVTPEVEINDNIVITDGRYAISFLDVDDAVITDNYIASADFKGDNAVEIKDGSGNTVKDNVRVVIKDDLQGYIAYLAEDGDNPNPDPLPDDAGLIGLTYSRALAAPGSAEGSGDTQIDDKPANLFTICLPFTPETGDAVKYYTLSSVSGETVNFDEVAEPVANTPYLMAVFGTGSFTVSCTELEVSSMTINSTTVDGYTFSGTFTGMTNADAQGNYVLQSRNRWGRVTAEKSTAFIPPFRAFIEGPADSACKLLSGSFDGSDDNVTGIKYIRTQNIDGTERYFDLNGRRIEKPVTKGIYIHNGKKEVLK